MSLMYNAVTKALYYCRNHKALLKSIAPTAEGWHVRNDPSFEIQAEENMYGSAGVFRGESGDILQWVAANGRWEHSTVWCPEPWKGPSNPDSPVGWYTKPFDTYEAYILCDVECTGPAQ